MSSPPERPTADHLVWEELRVFRTKEGATLTDLAKTADLSLGYISDLERGRREPTPQVVKKLSEVFGVPQYMLRKRSRAERRDAA